MADTGNNQPIDRKQFDRVQAAIWRRETEGRDGRRTWHSVTFSRSYRDDSGEWKSTNSYDERDLPHLELAVKWALRELELE